eukprot:CAMPEP_0182883722 /NCGR_PEP_ID=MMETSP0034_2-20130328/18555_1 /TAXON_ID=156128 /ORGANISM="Nephroselmis pyriformis, Strain CCMP717" /LENGTH=148 /DNA_ID=CAMNT_0025016871 /DNA_START=32 /DNA_END=475 /DNA_ORIENTATION=+
MRSRGRSHQGGGSHLREHGILTPHVRHSVPRRDRQRFAANMHHGSQSPPPRSMARGSPQGAGGAGRGGGSSREQRPHAKGHMAVKWAISIFIFLLSSVHCSAAGLRALQVSPAVAPVGGDVSLTVLVDDKDGHLAGLREGAAIDAYCA